MICPDKVSYPATHTAPRAGVFQPPPGHQRGVDRVTQPPASLTGQLAQLLQRPVDASARLRATALVADWLGCALGALRSPLARQLRGVAQAQAQGNGEATALTVGGRAVGDALLLNAALGNVLEMDDVHRGAILHPGPVVVPLALAACEAGGGNAEQFLGAVVRGYEATIRVGRALGRGHYRYWHPPSTAGAFGAAAAGASVLGLDAQATADALGTAGSRTGGLWQLRHEPVPTKSIHNVEAARSGWLAAQLAAAGVRGPRRILEGEQGLFAATAPDADPAAVVADEADWLLHGTSLKPWPACRHAHPAIDALLELLPRLQGIDRKRIARVEVATYAEALRFCDRPAPTTEQEAKFSLQHALASILVHGRPQLAHYLADACADAPVVALRSCVRTGEDPACSARFPAHYGARVEVLLDDGRRFQSARVDAWGDPECPMSESDIGEKAMALAAWGGVPETLARALFEQVSSLPRGGSLAALSGLLRQVGPACD